MTRVVVQRGGGPSNPSQRRDATPSASSASSSSSSSVSAPYSPAFPPESASVEDESEHHGYGEPGNLASDPDSRYSTCSSREKDEVGQKGNCSLDNLPEGLDRRKEGELGAVLIAAQVAGEGRIEGSGVWGEGEFGRALDLSDEDEGASWASERSGPDCENVECLRPEQILGTELVAGDISGRAQFQTQHCSQCSGASFHVSSTCPVQQSAQQSLAAESLGHATAQHSVPSLQYHLDAGGGGAVAFDKEDVDGGRANSVRNIIESVGCSYVSAPAPAASLSSCSSKSASRRGGWIGPAGSGVRASGPSRRLPRAMKSSRVSPNGSRPSSPRSFGDSDGYNSADEQTAWGSGPAAYEDDGERERQFEIDLRRLKNLEVRRMAEDGNCLFRAVADQVYGDTEMYDDTRQLCIDYMEKERDHFSSFVTESFTAYCKRKRRDKVYGNNLEIQAMAEMYNRPIHIYSYSTEPINIFHGSYETDLPPMRLSYHRSNHYNSLVDPCKPAVGAGLGFSSLRGRNVDREQVKAAIKAQQEQQIDKALLAEGRFYSDLELTEQEIERMVMEASRAEFLAEENHRQQFPGNEETSSSASGMPSSSRTMAIPEGAVPVVVDQLQGLQHTSRAISPSTAASTGSDVQLPSNVRMLLSMGFSYLRVIEAYNIFGDDVNNMLCYLLETETGSLEDTENMCRRKGKATEG